MYNYTSSLNIATTHFSGRTYKLIIIWSKISISCIAVMNVVFILIHCIRIQVFQFSLVC